MTDFVIPCEVFARLSSVLRLESTEPTEWFRSIRIEGSIAIASNRVVMAVENINYKNEGIVHVIANEALITQCRKEAPFKSLLTITVNEQLRYAVAKTTLGYVHSGNCVVWSDAPNDFDKWRSIVDMTRQPAMQSRGGMYWNAENIANLAASSPSGRVVFEEMIDCYGRPTIIRDINDYEWFGIFQPCTHGENAYEPATLPSWMVK